MIDEIDRCIQIAENVYVSDDSSDSFRESFGENASEVLASLYTKYVPDRIPAEQISGSLLCVYLYSVDSDDLKMWVQKAPLFVGDYGQVCLIVWETEAIDHDNAT
ncbi:hypothetical protein [Bacillus altitudinis]|uniref:hypothetical protein n=1 Tax=Bacillus altitudinis TaxID=293387 RepID=UPI0020C0B59B|nr:hypothetical protein [Bacillus altitudinis]